MWSQILQFLLTELAGSANIKVGPVNLSISTNQGEPQFIVGWGTKPTPATTPVPATASAS